MKFDRTEPGQLSGAFQTTFEPLDATATISGLPVSTARGIFIFEGVRKNISLREMLGRNLLALQRSKSEKSDVHLKRNLSARYSSPFYFRNSQYRERNMRVVIWYF